LAKTDDLEQSSLFLLMMQRSTVRLPLSFDSQTLCNGQLIGKPFIKMSLELLERFDENSNSFLKWINSKSFPARIYKITEIETTYQME
jgi:hypothetical protein